MGHQQLSNWSNGDIALRLNILQANNKSKTNLDQKLIVEVNQLSTFWSRDCFNEDVALVAPASK